MSVLTVTSKGQITLNNDILKHLGVHPGGRINVEKRPDGSVEVRAVRRKGKISDAFRMLKREGQRSISIEEMNEIIRKGWAGQL